MTTAAAWPILAYRHSYGGTITVAVGATSEAVTVTAGYKSGWAAQVDGAAQGTGSLWSAIADAVDTHSLVSAVTTTSHVTTSTAQCPQVLLRVTTTPGQVVTLASNSLDLRDVGFVSSPVALTEVSSGVYEVRTTEPWRGWWCPRDVGAQIQTRVSQIMGIATPRLDTAAQTVVRYGETSTIRVEADYVRLADIYEAEASISGYAGDRPGWASTENVLEVALADIAALPSTERQLVLYRGITGFGEACRIADASQYDVRRFSSTIRGQYDAVSLDLVTEV